MRFYEVEIQPTKAIMSNRLRVCTYRPYAEVRTTFDDQRMSGKIERFRITDLDQAWVIEDELYWFPMFCVELKRDYATLKDLVEDILVGKLSGILDVDIEFSEEEVDG